MVLSLHLLINTPKVHHFLSLSLCKFQFFDLVIFIFAVGNIQLLDQPKKSLNFTQRRCAVKPLYAEPKRNESIVPSAATFVAPGML